MQILLRATHDTETFSLVFAFHIYFHCSPTRSRNHHRVLGTDAQQ